MLPAAVRARDDRRARFEREAYAVARLNHPHICALYDVGSQDGIEFLVMKYLDGETFASRLRRGPLPVSEAVAHAAALAQAIAFAHQAGILHRDVKPSNVNLRFPALFRGRSFGASPQAPDGTRSSRC